MSNNNKTEVVLKARTMEQQLKLFAPEQMPYWHDSVRAIANELTRCALFSCRVGRAPREHYLNEQLFTLGDTAITRTGEELRGNDEDVFLTLAHLAREQKSGKLLVKVDSTTICHLNGWQPRQRYYNEIYKSILRLSATRLVIMSRRLTKMRAYGKAKLAGIEQAELARMYDEIQAMTDEDLAGTEVSGLMMSMVSDKVRFTGGTDVVDDIPQGNLQWEVPLDPDMVLLFAKPWLTLMPAEARREISYGARRLLGYFYGHREPYAPKVSTLGKLLRLAGPIKEQKRGIRDRVQELVDHKLLESAELGEGVDPLVHVVRNKHNGVENDSPEDGANDPKLPG